MFIYLFWRFLITSHWNSWNWIYQKNIFLNIGRSQIEAKSERPKNVFWLSAVSINGAVTVPIFEPWGESCGSSFTDGKNSEKSEGIRADCSLTIICWDYMSFLSVQIFAPRAHVWKAQIAILEKTQFWLVLTFWTVMIEFCLKKIVNALFKKTAKFKCLFNPYLNKFMWVSTWFCIRFRAFSTCKNFWITKELNK